MQKQVQQALLSELIELKESRAQYLDEHWVKSSVTRYDNERFDQEIEQVFKRQPVLALHSGELAGEGAFVTRTLFGLPLLFTRAADGVARCFLNVCRHRGAELVSVESGCKHKFVCPYHAWTYDTSGRLAGVPHEASGFPDLEREAHGLIEMPTSEQYGWVWLLPERDGELDVDASLGGLKEDFEALQGETLAVFDVYENTFKANWKFIVEGGLEAYHFKVAHKETIASLFQDNLSSYQAIDQHIRSVLPRSHLTDVSDQPKEQWDVRSYANLLYTIFPGSQFLVQQDHVVWIQVEPLAANETRLRLHTLVPAAENTEEKAGYWRRNHEFTLATLMEDFSIGEGIQRGLDSGANTHFNLGRYEGALDQFNRNIEACLDDS